MAGRKDRYNDLVKPYLDEINKKIREGVIESEIAKALGISVATLNVYKNKHPELRDALSKGKGEAVLQDLINAGLEAAKGYYKDVEQTVISLDEDGRPVKKQKTVTKQWFPPNPSILKMYLFNYGKALGFTNDPLEYELKKAKMEFDQLVLKQENWAIDFDENNDNQK